MRNTVLVVAVLAGLVYAIFHEYPDEPDTALVRSNPEPRVTIQPVSDEMEREVAEEMAPRSTFGGYPCADDCSAHIAGFQWAEEHSIRDPDSCEGYTGAFIEGCRVYADSRAEDEAVSALAPELRVAQR